jgi:hypothetical protein
VQVAIKLVQMLLQIVCLSQSVTTRCQKHFTILKANKILNFTCYDRNKIHPHLMLHTATSYSLIIAFNPTSKYSYIL